MDATGFPDITKMTLESAKEYIVEKMRKGTGDSHDVDIDVICRPLLDAAARRREADEVMRGSNVRVFHGEGQSADAKYTAVLFDAAWELVLEGYLRPGPKWFGVLNGRANGFSLTQAGREKFGL